MAEDSQAPTASPLSDSTVDAFVSLPEDTQCTTLGQMSPQTKQLLLGALQKRTTAAAATPPATTTSPPTQPDFLSRVGERIKQNVYAIPNAVDQATGATPAQPGVAAATKQSVFGDATSTLGKVANAALYGPRTLYSMAKSYVADPATAVGDVVTAAPELIEHGPAMVEKLNTAGAREPVIPRPPASTPTAPALAAEQQAHYTAALDKANADYATAAKKYYESATSRFDEAKRQQLEDAAAHKQAVEDVVAKHQEATTKAQADYDAEVVKEQKAQAMHQAKVDAARQSQQQAVAVEAKRQAIQTQQVPTLHEQVRTGAQQIYNAERSALDQRWNDVRDRVGTETPVAVKPLTDAINTAMKDDLRGSPGSIKQFKDLMHELGISEFQENADGTLTAAPSETAPWQTLRVHASALGRALSAGDLPGNVYHALKRVQEATDTALEGGAEAKGQGGTYRELKADEAKFRTDFEDMGSVALGKGGPLARLVRAPNTTFAGDLVQGKAGDILAKQLRDWNPKLADAIEQARSLAKQAKEMPKVSVIKEPPPPREATVPMKREVPPPELPEPPGTPEKKALPMPPSLAKVERPEPELPKGSPGMRRAVRVAGAMAGAAGGGVVAHPWLGMSVGREAADAVYQAYLKRRGPAIPPPPRP